MTRIDNHTQAILETTMDEWAVAELASRYKRFARRFRLEGSRAGNSRLVTRSKALELQALYGGTIRCLIETALGSSGATYPWCPTCGAEEDDPCVTAAGYYRRVVHHQRQLDADAIENQASMLACPRCKVEDNKPCRLPNGHIRREPHSARVRMMERLHAADAEKVPCPVVRLADRKSGPQRQADEEVV